MICLTMHGHGYNGFFKTSLYINRHPPNHPELMKRPFLDDGGSAPSEVLSFVLSELKSMSLP